MIGALRRAHQTAQRAPRAVFVFAAIAQAGLISFLSHVPGDRMPAKGFLTSVFFNLAHAPVFGVLAFFTAFSLSRHPSGGDRRLSTARGVLAAALALSFGFFDEWHQSFVSGRASDPTDLVTDLSGIVIGVIAARVLIEGKAPDRNQLRGAATCVIVAVAPAVIAS